MPDHGIQAHEGFAERCLSMAERKPSPTIDIKQQITALYRKVQTIRICFVRSVKDNKFSLQCFRVSWYPAKNKAVSAIFLLLQVTVYQPQNDNVKHNILILMFHAAVRGESVRISG